MTQDDYLGQDPAALSSAEDLDEDELRVDPLEKGMDPPEQWSPAIREAGTTPTQEDRLNAEQPDVQPLVGDALEGTHTTDTTDTTDDAEGAYEGPTRRTEPDDLPEEARRGQSADEGGGSVARDLRTPPPAR
ncbi:hypothetical protein [Labedaea rhizosphaerae]|uniref:DUF5709 domain-containing protein n=1 Tax=Labedaea rhizosphaerae TaxID=598644 RepID=A0A4R6SGN9_LABRH|nr:hypothetical protein [Labedaea rhizosphaerae]TDQ00884.1 hypothetical protein EV186_102750 [Labedaea rhizosphaerae]